MRVSDAPAMVPPVATMVTRGSAPASAGASAGEDVSAEACVVGNGAVVAAISGTGIAAIFGTAAAHAVCAASAASP